MYEARYRFTSESVTEGHPDKLCDLIVDSVLDAVIAQDPEARVALDAVAKQEVIILAGEITADILDPVHYEELVRQVVSDVGYTDPLEEFWAGSFQVHDYISDQGAEISTGIDARPDEPYSLGAGDQGMMVGYATDETREMLPKPIVLAHALTRTLAEDRKSGQEWMRPDGKAQVTVEYSGGRPIAVTDVVVSTQHYRDSLRSNIEAYVNESLLPRVLDDWIQPDLNVRINPAGSFLAGGPTVDTGLSGRKQQVDSYGGFARHGGGAFSGKDPTKVDRSAAYFARWAARQIVNEGIANRAEVQVAYAIGIAEPVSLMVETFGTGSPEEAMDLLEQLDFRPGAIIHKLDLQRPIYTRTTNYGHFGKPDLPWEE